MTIQLPLEYAFLNFDRFDVHVKGNPLNEAQIEPVKAVIASTTDLSLKTVLSRQLGIYYAFYKREAKSASHYFEIWQSSIKNQKDEEYAIACNYLGFANAIDDGYSDPCLFETAYQLYHTWVDTESDFPGVRGVVLDRAFASRYLAVTTRRQGISLLTNDPAAAGITISTALQMLSDVKKTQEDYHADSIDLAETYHLLAVFERDRKNGTVAENYINQALLHWQNVLKKTGAIHPMQYETGRLQAAWARIDTRESAGSPHFHIHSSESSSYQQPMEDTSNLTNNPSA